MKLFDCHIHLDQFSDEEITQILQTPNLHACLAVGTNLASCQRLLKLKQQFPQIYIAAGFHPEQLLPSKHEIEALFAWIEQHHRSLSAIGEVGLPHYTQRTNPQLDYQPYIALLERFILASKRYDLPLNLHIVYDDTQIALSLLAKHQVKQVHFHWFKASDEMIQKLLATPYFASFTPDLLWNPKTQKVAHILPLARILIETDAPYPQQGFNATSIVQQLEAVVHKLAEIKQQNEQILAQYIFNNACAFYHFFHIKK